MRMLCAAVRCSLFRLFPVRMANDKKCDDPDRKADEQILPVSYTHLTLPTNSRV